jgi:predicted sulfurtransferase/predicted O-methyltransferase YrrM
LSTQLLSSASRSSNNDIVAARLETQAAKRAAKAKSMEEVRERNLRLKRLISTEADNTIGGGDGSYPIPSLFALRVSVCQELREELRMNGREKRGRAFVEVGSDGTKTLKGLKAEVHAFFRALRRSTYVLSASLPEVAEDGSIVSPTDIESDPANATAHFMTLSSDEDVERAFCLADDLYGDATRGGDRLKRPSLLLHVAKDPDAPPPPPTPKYLVGMADPAQTESMTMLSFYAFPPEGVKDPEDFASSLRKKWKDFGALGRIYVAYEGTNAQMSVPTNVLENFLECCRSIPELGSYMENDINIDPIPLSVEEFQIAGDMNGKPAPPFKALHVRVRNKIVADGLDEALDWQSAGYDMPPLEWHQKLKEARKKRESGTDGAETPLIFDCRNTYETDVGIFEGAKALGTENFRDSWEIFREELADKPKDTPIMTYCTGGIRCVKVGAYLTQEMGFTNVSRLAGGIIAYDRTLTANATDEESMFKGVNYVFDGRVGRQITDDAMGECVTCGCKANLLSNCANNNCHRRMVQCETCRTAYVGTCSDACKQRVLSSGMTRHGLLPTDEATGSTIKYDNLDDYSAGHTSPAPSLYREIEANTAAHLATGAHMVSGASQGRLLTQLASMTREGRILELGTFTGYATCAFIEGAANAADVLGLTDSASPGGRGGGPFVMTLERDARAIDLAASHLRIMSEYGVGEEAAEAACRMRGENGQVEEVTEDSVAVSYENSVGVELMKVNDALATVEEMARGDGDVRTTPFDIVFVDADKTRLLEYVEACVTSDKLLKKGGLIVVDNVLWKGLVLGSSGGGMSQADIDKEENGLDDKALKKSRRARKLAGLMHKFNSAVVKDDRLEVVLLPMRDGLSIIRKK